MKTIVILGMLDTKGREVVFIKQEVQSWDHKLLVIDTGVVGSPYIKAEQ